MLKVYYELNNKEWVTKRQYLITTKIHSVNIPAFIRMGENLSKSKGEDPKGGGAGWGDPKKGRGK